MKYSPLVNQYANWLFDLIDRRDCGIRVAGVPKAINTTAYLDNWKEYPFPPPMVTRTDLDRHLRGEETFYYRSSRISGFALLMFDIDAHGGEQDARQLADWVIDKHLPGAYSEPSTGGKGVHIYAVMRVGRCTRERANAYLKGVADSLKMLVASEGYRATFCGIYGTFTTLKGEGDNRSIEKRGSMAKIPRLPDPEQRDSRDRRDNLLDPTLGQSRSLDLGTCPGGGQSDLCLHLCVGAVPRKESPGNASDGRGMRRRLKDGRFGVDLKRNAARIFGTISVLYHPEHSVIGDLFDSGSRVNVVLKVARTGQDVLLCDVSNQDDRDVRTASN